MIRLCVGVCATVMFFVPHAGGNDKTENVGEQISYYRQIRPIFQAHCQGCHQPAKRGGEYVMTSFSRLLKGGESGTAAITPKQPAQSAILELINPENGEAAMPKGKKPLSDVERDLIRKWIEQAAKPGIMKSSQEANEFL